MIALCSPDGMIASSFPPRQTRSQGNIPDSLDLVHLLPPTHLTNISWRAQKHQN
jgi:hypothetical protein